MLNFLRLAGLGAALALAAPVAHAQDVSQTASPARDFQPGRGGRGGADMLKELNLTADQQAKIEAIMRESRPAQRPSGPPTEAERQAMQARRAEVETKIKAVLTPEQVAKYDALRQQRNPRPAAPPAAE